MTSVEALVTDLARRDVRLSLDAGGLVVDAPEGVLSEADRVALSTRKALVVAWLQAQGRRAAPVALSPAWPQRGSWQYRYAVEGRHPLACGTCGARTLRPLMDGQIGCPPCTGTPAAATGGRA